MPNGTIRVANWDRWQSYRKDRGQPPWIKIHRIVLRNPEWLQLTDAEKGHLISIWILAADKDGEIPACARTIQKACGLDCPPDVARLTALGFLKASRRRQRDANVTHQRRSEEIRVDQKRSEKDSCAEPDKPASTPSPVFITIPVVGNGIGEAEITEAQIAGWRESYPGVDIEQQLRNMREWAIHNPTKRKTQRGIGRHITAWLAREQDRGGNGRGPTARMSAVDEMAAALGMRTAK